MYEYVCDVQAD